MQSGQISDGEFLVPKHVLRSLAPKSKVSAIVRVSVCKQNISRTVRATDLKFGM
jgi:hypothetical protein